MNALEIIEQVRAHQAELVLNNDHLVVRGRGDPLPDELQQALREHKAEVMVALGAPLERTVAAILPELRPNLPKALRSVPDSSLLVLVNWSIIAGWNRTIRNAHLSIEVKQ